MTREEKQLLLKDLCARQPYGVKVQTPNGIGDLNTIKLTLFGHELGINIKPTERETFEIKDCKPYLRPMSSMTEEEKVEYGDICYFVLNCIYKYQQYYFNQLFDWLNAHHFDYRGLIDRGLAIAVTEEYNPYKT